MFEVWLSRWRARRAARLEREAEAARAYVEKRAAYRATLEGQIHDILDDHFGDPRTAQESAHYDPRGAARAIAAFIRRREGRALPSGGCDDV